MKNPKRKQGVMLMIIGVLLFIFAIIGQSYKSESEVINEKENTSIKIAGKTFILEKLVSEAERIKGLSDRPNLAGDRGLLFVFEKPDLHGFWMKDMNFPISIIWLDEKCVVTGFKQNATPESYPEVFYPQKPSPYVVEVNPLMTEIAIDEQLDCSKIGI